MNEGTLLHYCNVMFEIAFLLGTSRELKGILLVSKVDVSTLRDSKVAAVCLMGSGSRG